MCAPQRLFHKLQTYDNEIDQATDIMIIVRKNPSIISRYIRFRTQVIFMMTF